MNNPNHRRKGPAIKPRNIFTYTRDIEVLHRLRAAIQLDCDLDLETQGKALAEIDVLVNAEATTSSEKRYTPLAKSG